MDILHVLVFMESEEIMAIMKIIDITTLEQNRNFVNYSNTTIL